MTLFDQAIVSAVAFLTGIIIARTCGKEEFGLYLLGFNIIYFLMEIHNVLIWTPYTYFSPQLSGPEHGLYAGSNLVHQLALSGVGIITLVVFGVLFSYGIGIPTLAPVIWMLVVAAGFILLREYIRRVCFANLEITTAIKVDFGVSLIQVLGLLGLVYFGRLSASLVFAVMGIACALVTASWFRHARGHLMFSNAEIVADVGRNWSFGKWILGGNMAEFASLQLFPWILSSFHGLSVVGILAACQGVIALARPFLQGIVNFLAPKTAHVYTKGGIRELRRLVVISTLAIGLAMSLFCVFMFAYGDFVLTFIYGSQYGGHALIISLLALDSLFFALHLGPDYGIWAMGRPDVNFKIALILLGITLTLGLWLVKTFGIVGVALGLLACNLVALLARLLVFFWYFR